MILQEVTFEKALEAYKAGKSGIVIDREKLEAYTLEDTFRDMLRWTYLVDYETDEKTIVEERLGKSTGEATETKKRKYKRTSAELEQQILRAWNGGERTITEVMAIVGCTYYAARKVLPLTAEG